MTRFAQRLSDLSDHHPRGRIVTKAAEDLALSDHPTTSDRKVKSTGEKRGWSPVEWRVRMAVAASHCANRGGLATIDDTWQQGPPSLSDVSAEDSLAKRALIAFLVRAAEDAFEALQTPDPDLDAERAVMASGRVQTTDQPCTNLPEGA
jgi:hypothetical protein